MDAPESSLPVEMQGWWVRPSAHWPEVSDQALAAWRRRERAKVKLRDDDARNALAFGFTGRLVYGERRDWDGVAAQLALDWSAAGFETPWKKARAAVKLGWTLARTRGQAREQVKLDARDTGSEVEERPGQQPVHGGRMVDHGG